MAQQHLVKANEGNRKREKENMFTPAAKRRRLDAANETLRKPFKSPAVRRDGDRDAGTSAAAAEDGTASSSAAQTDPGSAQRTGGASGARRLEMRQQTTPAKQLSTPTRPRPFSVPRPQHGASPSPLRRTPLARKGTVANNVTPTGIRSAREVEGREEIIRQAERIRRGDGGTDEELVALIDKWKAASRLAAEEVFEASKERVQSMGGMRAWRKTRREEQRSFMERMMEEDAPSRGHQRGGEDGADEEGESPPVEVGAERDGDEDGDGDEDEVRLARYRLVDGWRTWRLCVGADF